MSSSISTETLSKLACPGCGGSPLIGDERSLRCPGCSAVFPFVGSALCLVPDVGFWRAEQLRGLAEYQWVTESRIRQFRIEAELSGLLERTRERLLTAIEAKENERRVIARLFEALKSSAHGEPSPDVPVRADAKDPRLAVLECYENVFRDWVWGGPEIEQCLGLVKRLAPALQGAVGIYGAGACRLAVELHSTLGPERSFALDINPLPLLVAERLLAGETLGLYEFPHCPKDGTQFAVHHRIEWSERAPSGFQLLLADAKHPPFAPGSLDAVVTPWFIDAVDSDLHVTASGINRVLRPGGVWINLGPLQFNAPLPRCYALEEVHEIVEGSGFELGQTLREVVPYFDSPYGASLRRDTVYGFSAAKIREAAPFEEQDPRPAWIRDATLPIPQGPEVGAMGRRSAFTAAALSLIDGKRSLADLAGSLARSAGTTPEVMQEQLRAFFSKLPFA